MNNPFDYIPDSACDEAFRRLLLRIETLKESAKPEDIAFCRELAAGKMLGVLIANDSSGRRHTLYAFSGQIGDGGFSYPGFVGPVFDYLSPSSYFKTQERAISRRNEEIAQFETTTLTTLREGYEAEEKRITDVVEAYREECKRNKAARALIRANGLADEQTLAVMLRQSQFEKAELHRLKKKGIAGLAPYLSAFKDAESVLDAMKERRRRDSEELQKWLFDNFTLLNARGESRSLSDIFATTSLKVPPSGAGECCAPKLLQTAYMRGWRPLAMAEYWYGQPKGGEVRLHGRHYPACRGKCLPVLSWMLQGLEVEPPLESDGTAAPGQEPEILFENEWFCVVNKPSGMLSVPGKGGALSVQEWLSERYGPERHPVKMAHRLDQDTSGLLVATFGELPFKIMQSLFARREVDKTYMAELEGDYQSRGLPRCGRIELPLSPDWLDRPRQRVDFKDGKEAVTDYEFIGVADGRSRVTFHPHTGRTHQLRVHAASAHGLGMSIAGDRLYGVVATAPGRLRLHAHRLEFTFPLDDRRYSFESPLPF